MLVATGNIGDTVSGVEREISLIESGHEDVIKVNQPDVISGLLWADVLLQRCSPDGPGNGLGRPVRAASQASRLRLDPQRRST